MCRFRKLLWVAYLFSTTVSALPDDVRKPMQITADSTSFDYKRGTGLYEGHVVVIQGKTRLRADRLMTFNNCLHKIDKVIAYGLKQPARYNTLLSITDSRPLLAEASMIRFYPFHARVELTGNAKVQHGEDQFQGPIAIYDMKNQTVNAPQSTLGRSKILIKPDQIAS